MLATLEIAPRFSTGGTSMRCRVVFGCLLVASLMTWGCGSSGIDDDELSSQSDDALIEPGPPKVCADLAAQLAAALDLARACNPQSAQAMATCQYVVPTIVGCGAPVSSKAAPATGKYLYLYQ